VVLANLPYVPSRASYRRRRDYEPPLPAATRHRAHRAALREARELRLSRTATADEERKLYLSPRWPAFLPGADQRADAGGCIEWFESL
jgi:hypothetical protein